MAPVEEADSGMESLVASSKDLTPEKNNAPDLPDDADDEVCSITCSLHTPGNKNKVFYKTR